MKRSQKINFWKIVTAFLFLILVVISYFLFNCLNHACQNCGVFQTTEVSEKLSGVVEERHPSAIEKINYTKKGSGNFSSYKISYSSDWKMEENQTFFFLRKNGATFSINQGGFGGGECVYSEMKERRSPGVGEYSDFFEIKKENGKNWRFSKSASSLKPEGVVDLYVVCEADEITNRWKSVTSIGGVTLEITKQDSALVEEINQLLENIEIVE